ncbi:mycofactocin precursor MftA [Streptomyces sp. NPDC004237]
MDAHPDLDEAQEPQEPEELTAEGLIEEVSIDGMCGVY